MIELFGKTINRIYISKDKSYISFFCGSYLDDHFSYYLKFDEGFKDKVVCNIHSISYKNPVKEGNMEEEEILKEYSYMGKVVGIEIREYEIHDNFIHWGYEYEDYRSDYEWEDSDNILCSYLKEAEVDITDDTCSVSDSISKNKKKYILITNENDFQHIELHQYTE